MKITCFKLEESFIDLDEVLLNEIKIMSETETANDALIKLDSLEGDAAGTLKDYFFTVHSPIISGFMAVCAELHLKLTALFEDYHATVDSKRSSVLCDEYIFEKKQKIGTIQSDLNDVTSKLHTILGGVSDIFSTSASYATYESEISANVLTAQQDIQKVVTDLETFNTTHISDCTTIVATLEDVIRIIDMAQNVFVDNQISSVNNEDLLAALSSLDTNISDLTEKIMEDPSEIREILDFSGKMFSLYGLKELLDEADIAITDYRKLIQQGLRIQVNSDSTGKFFIQIIGDGKGPQEVKDIIKAMDINHMTNTKIGKITGPKGLLVINDIGNIKSPCLVNALTDVEGFRYIANATNNKDLAKMVKGSGFRKTFTLADGIGYGLAAGVNLIDNSYDVNTGKWTFDSEVIADTVTDTATDIVIDQGIQIAFIAIGTAICPGAGTAIGAAVGAGVSFGLSVVEFGEPPKTVVDHAKDWVSDISHSVADVFSNLFW